MGNKTKNITENKMGTMNINKLILNMSLPMMISMLVQALYNVVDSIFVAKINEDALTAVSLSFPIQLLMSAIAAGTGVGINAVLSKALGEKNFKKVDKTATNGVFLAIMSYLLALVIGLFFVTAFFKSQTNNTQIIKYGTQYLTVICIFSFGMFSQFTFERLLQSTGRTFYTMITQGTGAIINIILDPILIFGLFGFPKMGVTGAAVATVFGQCVAGFMAIVINHKKNDDVNVSFKKFKPDGGIISQIYIIGVPSIIMQAIGSIMNYGMNKILISFTSTAVAVFGAYFKLQSFIFMPVFGLNNGMIPIISYNYGAGNKERMIKAIKSGILFAMSIMTCGMIVFQAIPGTLLNLFKTEAFSSDLVNASIGQLLEFNNLTYDFIEIGIPALKIISLSFIFAGFCIICGTVFQSLGRSYYSMITSITRQLVIILPVAYLLAKFGGLSYVWWSIAIAEIVSVILSIFFLTRIYKNVIKNI